MLVPVLSGLLLSVGRPGDGKPFHHVHLFITTLRTSPKALLRLVRQRWAIENQWHWPRDSQLGEDAHRYTHAMVSRSWLSCGPWLSIYCAGTVSDRSAQA